MKTLRIKSIEGLDDFQHVTANFSQYVRLLFYGGAKSKSDNSAFYNACQNVKKDYNNDGNIKILQVDTAKKIVENINLQKENSIQSIDFFSHGDMLGLYFIKGASLTADIIQNEVEKNNLNSSLYLGSTTKFFMGSNVGKDSRTIGLIDFSRFTINCKIEIHGCLTAHDMYVKDNICEELSELLSDADKKNAVVIGHSKKANPNIKGSSTKISEQDYRHGERKIFNDGDEILTTKKQGKITFNDIDTALKNK